MFMKYAEFCTNAKQISEWVLLLWSILKRNVWLVHLSQLFREHQHRRFPVSSAAQTTGFCLNRQQTRPVCFGRSWGWDFKVAQSIALRVPADSLAGSSCCRCGSGRRCRHVWAYSVMQIHVFNTLPCWTVTWCLKSLLWFGSQYWMSIMQTHM